MIRPNVVGQYALFPAGDVERPASAECGAAIREDTYCYFIYERRLKDMLKIGKADVPKVRLLALQTGNPRTLAIAGTILGDVESYYHDRFRSARIRIDCEWFKVNEEIRSFIETTFGIRLKIFTGNETPLTIEHPIIGSLGDLSMIPEELLLPVANTMQRELGFSVRNWRTIDYREALERCGFTIDDVSPCHVRIQLVRISKGEAVRRRNGQPQLIDKFKQKGKRKYPVRIPKRTLQEYYRRMNAITGRSSDDWLNHEFEWIRDWANYHECHVDDFRFQLENLRKAGKASQKYGGHGAGKNWKGRRVSIL